MPPGVSSDSKGPVIAASPPPDAAAPASGPRRFADRRQAFRGGAADALRMPIYVVFGSMLGFGSLAQDLSIGFGVSVVSTAAVWGLPGQVAFVELFAVGAPVAAIALASSMANLRFLPMSLAMMPLFRGDPGAWRWRYAFVAMMSVNTWALTMQHGPAMPVNQRVAYFTGLSAVCMTTGVVATALGYHLAGTLPYFVSVSLIFLNPVYFTFLFATVRHRGWVLAILFGAVLGPIIHLISPEWGLPFCGVIAGSAAYVIDRRRGGGDG